MRRPFFQICIFDSSIRFAIIEKMANGERNEGDLQVTSSEDYEEVIVQPSNESSNTVANDGTVDERLLDRAAMVLLRPELSLQSIHRSPIELAVRLIQQSRKIMVLVGAGMSVSCGISDFRSANGIYARLRHLHPELPDPTAVFDIDYFYENPKPFFSFVKELFPGNYRPSLSHRFLKCLEDEGKLLRVYTQNVDTLEKQVGLHKVVYCHGSFDTATCMECGFRVDCEEIRDAVFNEAIPTCRNCAQIGLRGVMKPDIVFFGESLPRTFYESVAADQSQVDLLIVIGSSLKVRPVSLIPRALQASVPLILINRETLNLYFDVELLGDSDVICEELCSRLSESFHSLCPSREPWTEITDHAQLTSDLNTLPNSEEMGSRIKISEYLPEKSFFRFQHNMLVFPGAEVYVTKESQAPMQDYNDQPSVESPVADKGEAEEHAE
ncbi:NAD-dependent protein deacetylase sirtuin-1 [Trichinella papuae]|uniref:NAD-dependent protein deacetylase sirtuin-1 n=1 Tax=Trichinella papuae TaxID=268474 RepID=A0A0V1N1P1_9BILA|nr:NAD-dependent protein deacetylase sirtuin-1 [Trichinella papuae]